MNKCLINVEQEGLASSELFSLGLEQVIPITMQYKAACFVKYCHNKNNKQFDNNAQSLKDLY